MVFAVSFLTAFFWVCNLYAQISGSAYVPSSKKEISDILSRLNLNKGQTFLELGSGDGRVIHLASKKYQVSATGVDINPILIWYSRIVAKIKKIKANFICQNIFKTDLTQADIIFLFMMPDVLVKLKPKLKKETKKGVRIVSHGFYFEGWDKYIVDKLDHKPFPTFFYILK